ncbi:MAG TPA: hypothetical protein VHM88_18780 [Candidatus Acidoferrales bacterium]|nr:hypothetical protein [Candidatus Acidoferrales bacterium]
MGLPGQDIEAQQAAGAPETGERACLYLPDPLLAEPVPFRYLRERLRLAVESEPGTDDGAFTVGQGRLVTWHTWLFSSYSGSERRGR